MVAVKNLVSYLCWPAIAAAADKAVYAHFMVTNSRKALLNLYLQNI